MSLLLHWSQIAAIVIGRRALAEEYIGRLLARVLPRMPKLRTRLVDLGGTLLAGSPADFGKLIADDTEKWGKVIRAANIKAE